MRSSIIMTAAMATFVFASPLQRLEKRVLHTIYREVVVTEVLTVTATGTAPKPTIIQNTNHRAFDGRKDAVNNRNHGGWGTGHDQQQEAAAAASSAPAPKSSAAPAASSSPAPKVETSQSKTSSATSIDSLGPRPASFEGQVEWHHNIHRLNHSAPLIKYDASLAQIAQQIANTCLYNHSMKVGGGGYGQNIAAGAPKADVGGIITEMFYNGEVAAYAAASSGYSIEPDMSTNEWEAWGHMSQLVWKDTTQVGCAVSDCTSRGLANTDRNVAPFFTVCNYKSAGNFRGTVLKNVLAPKMFATYSGKGLPK